jgi:hypothetical protein
MTAPCISLYIFLFPNIPQIMGMSRDKLSHEMKIYRLPSNFQLPASNF